MGWQPLRIAGDLEEFSGSVGLRRSTVERTLLELPEWGKEFHPSQMLLLVVGCLTNPDDTGANLLIPLKLQGEVTSSHEFSRQNQAGSQPADVLGECDLFKIGVVGVVTTDGRGDLHVVAPGISFSLLDGAMVGIKDRSTPDHRWKDRQEPCECGTRLACRPQKQHEQKRQSETKDGNNKSPFEIVFVVKLA